MEKIIVFLIVGTVSAILLRHAWKFVKGGCRSGCGSCPSAKNCSKTVGAILKDVPPNS